MSLTPPGWAPVDLGEVQISVPGRWMVEDPGYSCGGSVDRLVFINRPSTAPPGVPCPRSTNVASLGTSSPTVVPHATSDRLNGIAVIRGWSQNDAGRTEIIRAVGIDVTASGPQAQQVLATLTYSPLAVVLDSPSVSAPTGWRQVNFGGLRFAIPPQWRVDQTSLWGGCPYNLNAATLTLSTAEVFSAPGCLPPSTTALAITGVPAMVVGAGPQIGPHPPGATCIERNHLQICIDPPPNPDGGFEPGHGLEILTAQVTVPHRALADEIQIGLSGDGTIARSIYDSLLPSTT